MLPSTVPVPSAQHNNSFFSEAPFLFGDVLSPVRLLASPGQGHVVHPACWPAPAWQIPGMGYGPGWSLWVQAEAETGREEPTASKNSTTSVTDTYISGSRHRAPPAGLLCQANMSLGFK